MLRASLHMQETYLHCTASAARAVSMSHQNTTSGTPCIGCYSELGANTIRVSASSTCW